MTDNKKYQRIACEEAFFPPEIFQRYLEEIKRNPSDEPGFMSLMGFFLVSQDPYPLNVRERLLDLGERRIHDMDESGIDKQLIFLTAPGVQIFDAPTANSLATLSNDQLAQACRDYPHRFAGLAAVAPQDPHTGGHAPTPLGTETVKIIDTVVFQEWASRRGHEM